MASIKLIPGFESFSESVNEAEFKHINKDEHAIKLAIKDVEKKVRLKANRDKPIEYEQLSLNKIMLSKVLGRGKLEKEHQDAWKKLKKEYNLKESVVSEDNDTVDNLNSMANTDLERIADYADMIKDRMLQGQTLDAWMYSKISDSVKNLNSVHDTMDGNDGVTEAAKHEFNPNETAERLKRREQQNIERFRAAQDREDPFAVQYYQLRVSLDKIDLQRLKIQTSIHQLKQKYKK